MTINQIYEIYKAHPVVTTDNRQCEQGAMFFALKGASFDGNQFAASALEAGCAYAVVDEKEYAPEGDARYILVDDVLSTLQQLAQYHRQQLTIPVLQITGTNGKTTTKELVSAVLSRKYSTLFTQGNLNNHIGVPRTLLRIRPEHEIAVIETGANHPGEIDFLCGMVQADYGLITNVGRAHLEGFGSFEGVKKTKGELYDDLAKRGKMVFLNAFDDDLMAMVEKAFGKIDAISLASHECENVMPYVEGRVEDCSSFLRIQWRKEVDMPWHTVQTHLVGAYNIANIRAAITVGLYFGVDEADINQAIADYQPTNSRSEFRETAHNKLIVDAYNANPSSMNAALTNFAMMNVPQKMVILGDMRELGANSEQEHRSIIERLVKDGVELAWLVGEEFCKVVKVNPQPSAESTDGVQIRTFAHVDEVKAELQAHLISGRTILIKGSNGTKLFQLPELL
ncbi:MAG: UDP-N-acetylmuramoyl-tripeptide--D-alanyl-D-alanine ligase [Bacteroidaceae bacterium]|nr:UDP-N-acetylmuramoyl-tripeptide--D-alanyl-D-alanine ligase [Bacteroidaceae bacterium]